MISLFIYLDTDKQNKEIVKYIANLSSVLKLLKNVIVYTLIENISDILQYCKMQKIDIIICEANNSGNVSNFLNAVTSLDPQVWSQYILKYNTNVCSYKRACAILPFARSIYSCFKLYENLCYEYDVIYSDMNHDSDRFPYCESIYQYYQDIDAKTHTQYCAGGIYIVKTQSILRLKGEIKEIQSKNINEGYENSTVYDEFLEKYLFYLYNEHNFVTKLYNSKYAYGDRIHTKIPDAFLHAIQKNWTDVFNKETRKYFKCFMTTIDKNYELKKIVNDSIFTFSFLNDNSEEKIGIKLDNSEYYLIKEPKISEYFMEQFYLDVDKL